MRKERGAKKFVEGRSLWMSCYEFYGMERNVNRSYRTEGKKRRLKFIESSYRHLRRRANGVLSLNLKCEIRRTEFTEIRHRTRDTKRAAGISLRNRGKFSSLTVLI